jgi:polygalacturonase
MSILKRGLGGRLCDSRKTAAKRERNGGWHRSTLEALEGRCLLSSIPLPTIPAGTFDVTSYGAKGDGTTVNTSAIQSAINAARDSSAHGGTVLAPNGCLAL